MCHHFMELNLKYHQRLEFGLNFCLRRSEDQLQDFGFVPSSPRAAEGLRSYLMIIKNSGNRFYKPWSGRDTLSRFM